MGRICLMLHCCILSNPAMAALVKVPTLLHFAETKLSSHAITNDVAIPALSDSLAVGACANSLLAG
jgi:hypothetical protein